MLYQFNCFYKTLVSTKLFGAIAKMLFLRQLHISFSLPGFFGNGLDWIACTVFKISQ